MESTRLTQAAGLPLEECVSASLDLFSGPSMETSIERCYYDEIFPQSPLSDTASLISFHLPPSEDLTDCSECFIKLRLSLSTMLPAADALPIRRGPPPTQAATASYALINQAASSIFSSVNVRISDVSLSDSYQTYPYLAMIQSILNFSKDSRDTKCSLMGFTSDEDPTVIIATNNEASGFKTRAGWTDQGVQRTYISPIFHDFFHQSRLLLPLTNLYLDFTKASNAFAITSNKANADYHFKIEDFRLFVRRVKTTPSTKLYLENELASGKPARYPLVSSTVKPYFINAGAKSHVIENVFSGKGIPRFCLVAFCLQTDYRGAYGTSPFTFPNFSLTSLKLTFGSHTFPSPPFAPLYVGTNPDHTREYLALMYNTFKSDVGSMITYDNFKNYYALYVMDLGHFSISSTDHVLPKVDVNARLDMAFHSTSNNAALTALVYTEYDVELQIDSARNVTRDYIL